MKRRGFLKGSIGTFAAGASGCVSLGELISPNWANVTPAEMDHFLTRLDGAMNRIAQNPDGGQFVTRLQRRPPSQTEARLFRQGMRSLLLAGNFGDLSVAGQTHPGVQKRLNYSAPEMDSTVFGMMDRMESLSPTARADMKAAIREDPNLADRVLEAIDNETVAVGVPTRRRLQLRVMGKHIVTRLKHSSDMLIDEYVTKCRKVAAQPGSPAELQRLMATRLGEKAFKARLLEVENAARRWQAIGVKEVPIGYELLQEKGAESEEESDKWYRKGKRMLGIGAITTGVGLVLIAIGGGLDNDDNPLVVPGVILGVTVGPIMILIGLITLLIGGMVDLGDGP